MVNAVFLSENSPGLDPIMRKGEIHEAAVEGGYLVIDHWSEWVLKEIENGTWA